MSTETPPEAQNVVLQGYLDRGEKIPEGEYWVDAESPLSISGNSGNLVDLTGVVIRLLPTDKDSYSILNLTRLSGVTILEGTIMGDRESHLGTAGEWGMGIRVDACEDIVLRGTSIYNCWGDGIYVVRSVRVLLEGVVCDNNRRNGLTLTHAHGVTSKDCVFKNNGGVSPGCGVDIEPNANQHVSDVVFENCTFKDNRMAGLTISRPAKHTGTASVRHVTAVGCSVYGGVVGVRVSGAKYVVLNETSVFDTTLGLFASGSERVSVLDGVFRNNGVVGSSGSWTIRAKNCQDLLVQGNHLDHGFGIGIGTTDCSGAIRSNKVIYYGRTTNRNDAGISLSNWLGPVTNNIVNNNPGWGFVLDYGCDSEELDRMNTITNNGLGVIKQVQQ